jgi:hypothetical protein
MTQMVECLPSNYEALSSNLSNRPPAPHNRLKFWRRKLQCVKNGKHSEWDSLERVHEIL